MKPSKEERKKIPHGDYCYERLEQDLKKPYGFKTINPCPFWSIRKGYPKQENGYCAYLKKGDWEINEERGDLEWKDKTGKIVQVTKPHEIGVGLLWDQVKECGVNMERVEDEKSKHFHSKKK